jgi:hypothetical protein
MSKMYNVSGSPRSLLRGPPRSLKQPLLYVMYGLVGVLGLTSVSSLYCSSNTGNVWSGDWLMNGFVKGGLVRALKSGKRSGFCPTRFFAKCLFLLHNLVGTSGYEGFAKK